MRRAPIPAATIAGATFVAILLTLPSLAFAIPRGQDGQALRDAANALSELRVEDAARATERLVREHPDDPDVRFERAMVRFHQGDYAGAVQDLEVAGDEGRLRSPEDRRELRALIGDTHEATRSFLSARSEDGRYVVRYAPGPDAILVPYAIEAMRAADAALGAELGVRLPGPIRLEIYPSAVSLAQVSSLTVEEIATTGTIALCKWDRLMVSSPRALVRGYPWMDTIGHELVHLFLARASRDRAPVWLQEGVAKFLERSWRGDPPAAHLDPSSEVFLRDAVTQGTLLPFERLHPSIARLPSQEMAALAFAQVATFVEDFHRQHGATGLRAAIAEVAQGVDAREALAHVSGHPFAQLERSWRASLRERPAPEGEAPHMLGLRLRQGEGPADEARDVQNDAARRHLRLGDLLWDRHRAAGASLEYGRAHGLAPDDPIVASRYARAALTGGRPAEAVEALESFRARYPDHAPTWALSGAGWLALGDLEHARTALREAIRINPFDPAPHCDLAEASDREEERSLERATCAELGGRRQ